MDANKLLSEIESEIDKIYHEVLCAGGNDFIEDALLKIEKNAQQLAGICPKCKAQLTKNDCLICNPPF